MALPTFVTRVEVTTTSSTNNLTTAAFTTTGSNRAIIACLGGRSSGIAISSLSRGSDTFTDPGVSTNVAGAAVDMWHTSNEPATASTTLQMTLTFAATVWGFHAVVMSDVNQTTRVTGAVANADQDASNGMTDLTVASGSTDNLVMDVFAVRSNSGTPTADGSQTSRGVYNASTLHSGVSTLPGTGGNVSMGWGNITSPADGLAHMAWAVNGIASNDPPVNTVTADANPIPLNVATAVPSPPTVAEGSSDITSIVVSVDAGTVSMTAIAPVTVSNNGTSAVTLQNGTTAAHYNDVLATMTHTRATKGLTTFTILSSDGTLSDSDNFTRFVAPAGINFSGTHTQIRSLIQSLNCTLDTGDTSGVLTLYVEDSGARSASVNVEVLEATTPPLNDGTLTLTVSTRQLSDVIM